METHPLVADALAEVADVLAVDPPLTAAEAKLALKPALTAFLAEVRGPGCKTPPADLADRPPLENAFTSHPVWKEFCRRYGAAVVALGGGD